MSAAAAVVYHTRGAGNYNTRYYQQEASWFAESIT